MADALWAAYPALQGALQALATGRSWCLTGVSALVYDESCYLLEITKPKHWRRLPGGRLRVGLGAIGGSLEEGEGVLACLDREAAEELGARLRVEPARSSLLVYEERQVEEVPLRAVDAHPLPALFTVSRNLHRRAALPGREVLAIVTFLAALCGDAAPRDVFGLLRVPHALLPEVLSRPATVGAVLALPGVRIETHRALPADAELVPVWTARSLQILAERGRLGDVLPR